MVQKHNVEGHRERLRFHKIPDLCVGVITSPSLSPTPDVPVVWTRTPVLVLLLGSLTVLVSVLAVPGHVPEVHVPIGTLPPFVLLV